MSEKKIKVVTRLKLKKEIICPHCNKPHLSIIGLTDSENKYMQVGILLQNLKMEKETVYHVSSASIPIMLDAISLLDSVGADISTKKKEGVVSTNKGNIHEVIVTEIILKNKVK